jgi:hypothetical protein
MEPMQASERFEPSAISVRRARRFIDRHLRRWQCEDVREVTDLLATEVVADAVRQAPSQVAVHVEADDDRLRVEVSDDPGVVQHPESQRFERRAARRLVRRLASRWGSDLDRDRTTTWFEVQRHP